MRYMKMFVNVFIYTVYDLPYSGFYTFDLSG
jgi:hypothetical protein